MADQVETTAAGDDFLSVNPADQPEVYDKLSALGMESPGRVKIQGAASTYDWDTKKGKGTSGATVTYQGRAPAEFDAVFYLWLPEHFAQWDEFSALLDRAQVDPKNITAIDLTHPYLNKRGIRACVVKSVGQLEQVREGDTLHTATVKFGQFEKAKPATGTPGGSKGDGTQWKQSSRWANKTPNDASAAQEAELEKLLKEAQKP